MIVGSPNFDMNELYPQSSDLSIQRIKKARGGRMSAPAVLCFSRSFAALLAETYILILQDPKKPEKPTALRLFQKPPPPCVLPEEEVCVLEPPTPPEELFGFSLRSTWAYRNRSRCFVTCRLFFFR